MVVQNKQKRFTLKKTVFLKSFWFSEWMIIGTVALIALVLHLITIQDYGYFRDEFYYLACSNHLDFGYVDQPPLSILILKMIRFILGDSLVMIRLLPALAHGFWIFFTGLIAKEFGGKKFGVLLASITALAPVGNFFIFHFYLMNFWDFLFWQICIVIVLKIIKNQNPKTWILFGLMAGFGLQNKISVLFLCFGLFIGLLFTSNRKYFKSEELWLGAGLAILFFIPYIIWNGVHNWPTLEFIHNARVYKMSDVTPLVFLWDQIGHNNPMTTFIWLAGLIYFFFHKEGKGYRIFGYMFLSIYILFTIQEAKAYYFAPVYTILFAGGAVQWESLLRSRYLVWARSILILVIGLFTLILCPFGIPILPVEKTIIYLEKIGLTPSSGENHEMGVLPQHYADMHGWQEMVKTVADVYSLLSPEEKDSCLIYVRNYGEAGAIDLFGKEYGLPKATCAQNNYWFWGPPKGHFKTAIIFGPSRNVQESLENLNPYFESVEHAATFKCRYCMPYENNRPMFICRGAKFSFEEIWTDEKHFD